MQSSANPTFFASPVTSDIRSVMERIIQQTDIYKVLNITPKATSEEIDKAYRVLIVKLHADKHTDPELKKLSEAVTAKLNFAREEAKNGCGNSSSKKRRGEQINVVKQFSGRMFSVGLGGLFDLDFKALDLMHGFDAYNVGIITLWVMSVLNNNEAATLKVIEAGLKNKPLKAEVLQLAKDVHHLIKDLTITSSYKNTIAGLDLETEVDISWNIEKNQALAMIRDVMTRFPGRPVIVHNTTFGSDVSTYVGLYARDENFYLFDANQITFKPDTTSLPALTWRDVSDHLGNVFFSAEGRLMDVNGVLSAPLSINVLRPKMAARLDQTSVIAAAFQTNVISTFLNSSECTPTQVLQNVADFEIPELLVSIAKKNPDYFSPALLLQYLQIAVANDNITLALEICKLGSDWHGRYLHDYFAAGRPIELLPDMLSRFKKAGIDLEKYVTTDMQQHGSSDLDGFNDRAKDKSVDMAGLDAFLTLGMKLSHSQRENLVMQLSGEINSVAMDQVLYEGQKKIGKQPLDEKVLLKYQERIKPMLDVFHVLAKHRYTLTPSDGAPMRQHPSYTLIMMDKMEEVKRFHLAGLLDFNKVDEKRLAVLNHLTKSRRWSQVKELIALGATYSSGPDIEWDAIPPFVAYFDKQNELRELYKADNFSLVYQLESMSGDVLCIAAGKNDVELISNILAHGFRDKLRASPVRYLYSAFSAGVAKALVAQLEPQYLVKSTEAKTPQLLRLQERVKVTPIVSDSHSKEEPPIELLGVARGIIDAYMKRLHLPELTKIEWMGSDDIYYSTEPDLTNKLELIFSAKEVKACYASIMEQIKRPRNNTLPDLSCLLNELILLQNIILQVREFSDRRSFDLKFQLDSYLRENRISSPQIYNNMLLLKEGAMPLGIKISFDKTGLVKHYCVIDKMELLALENFMNVDAMLPDRNLSSDYGTHIFMAALMMYNLKAIFEETLNVSFGPINTCHDASDQRMLLGRYDMMRKRLSPDKVFAEQAAEPTMQMEEAKASSACLTQ